jgi:hypothetical protein
VGNRRAAGLALFLLLYGAADGHAQRQRTIGIHVGRVRAEQLWADPVTGTTSTGYSVGVGVDVPTPARSLSVRAGLGYVQRGSGVWDQEQDPEQEFVRNVRSHYLTVPVEGKMGLEVGPMAVYLVAGPVVEMLLGTQCSQDLCPSLEEERPLVLSANLGAGLSIPFRDRAWADLEIRLTEGLTSSYSSLGTGLRYRSLEFLVRARVPF